MRGRIVTLGAVVALLGLWAAPAVAQPAAGSTPPPAGRPNVLFVAFDDLRPAIGCFGDPLAKTPNLDRLAARGVAFTRAYCQQAVCSPSRSSLLTGRRPDQTKVWDLKTHFRTALPDVVTLPQLFKQAGYVTEGLGKIYHDGYDDPPSWSEPSWKPKARGYGPGGAAALARQQEAFKAAGKDPSAARPLPYESMDAADDALPDGLVANEAVARLKRHKADGKPFFLAVGFLKPHLPFVAPKKYWDLHDPAKFKVPAHRELPTGAPKFAGNNSGELRAYATMPAAGPVSDAEAVNLIHGYYAAASYADAQLGKVLDALDAEGLAGNTVVVVWGDHGWSLGEHGLWCKHTNYEDAARAPLIVAGPGVPARGARCDRLVEFVDVYPTLAELAGVPRPDGLAGTSLAPLLADPAKAWKPAAFSQYPRAIPQKGAGMGYTVRTDRYRLVEWRVKGETAAVELYDHQADPAETVNLAADPAHAATVKELTAMLAAERGRTK
ncbi:MAG TPA: sulfatase [Humisphaera sp.]